MRLPSFSLICCPFSPISFPDLSHSSPFPSAASPAEEAVDPPAPVPVWACILSGLASSSCIVWCLTWALVALLVDNKTIATAVTAHLALFISMTALPLFAMVTTESLVDWNASSITKVARGSLFLARILGSAIALAVIKLVFLELLFPSMAPVVAAAAAPVAAAAAAAAPAVAKATEAAL